MKTTQKQLSARAYLAMMQEADTQHQFQVQHQKPTRIAGGCLLYTLKNSRVQQHPPTPYYS